MRRILLSAVVAAAAILPPHSASAAPPTPPTPTTSAWRVSGHTLTWTAPKGLAVADAAVEFWSGDRLLGRADSRDLRTFTLTAPGPVEMDELQVRAAGRRLDAPPPVSARNRVARPPLTLPAVPPRAATDPGKPGRFKTVEGEYSLPDVTLNGLPEPVEMRGLVIAPAQAGNAKRPFALFLHGRHFTCFAGDSPQARTAEWPCPAGHQPIPSHLGYRQAQRLLASQGYVTVSISANGVNGQDGPLDDAGGQARSTLVRRHLARWAGWTGSGRRTAPEIVRQAPRADMSKVLLIGHSRGGEGVNRAAMDSLRPPPSDGFTGKATWKIRGLVMIGPTAFGNDPAPDVPSVTFLPGCDGDVSDLAGQQYLDATRGVSDGRALHSALYFIGANHNFFNTEWTPGQSAAPSDDDFYTDEQPDPLCGSGAPTRLTPEQQQTAGATYIATAAKVFVEDDDKALPLLDGTGLSAPSAGPARVLSHAIGGARTPVVIPGPELGVTGGRLCDQINADQPARACIPPREWFSPAPHFTGFWEVRTEPDRYAVEIAAGKPAVLTPARPATVRGELAMRLIVPPNTTGNRFGVTVNGKSLGEVTVDGLPGTDRTASHWAREVRVPLNGVTKVAKLQLTPRGQATGWLIDAWSRRPGTPEVRPKALPRIDLGTVEKAEGDDGTKTLRVPVTVTGRGTGRLRIFVLDSQARRLRSFLATVKPGDRSVRVPIEVTGNRRFSADRNYQVLAKAVRGLFVGGFTGEATIRNDDPAPKVTIEPVADTVAEGETLRWQLRLSEPADSEFYLYTRAEAPAGAPELSTSDVPAAWLADQGVDAEPSRPLSEAEIGISATVPPGETTARAEIPTVTDDQDEPEEQVRLATWTGAGEETLPGDPLTGRVR